VVEQGTRGSGVLQHLNRGAEERMNRNDVLCVGISLIFVQKVGAGFFPRQCPVVSRRTVMFSVAKEVVSIEPQLSESRAPHPLPPGVGLPGLPGQRAGGACRGARSLIWLDRHNFFRY